MLGHKISKKEIDMDRKKMKVNEKLPPPILVKEVRIFLGHAGFYRRFIKDFSKITNPLGKLLENEVKFEWNEECLKSFNCLKEKLVEVSIIIAPN